MGESLASCKNEGKASQVDAPMPTTCERCNFSVVKRCGHDKAEDCGNYKARQKIGAS